MRKMVSQAKEAEQRAQGVLGELNRELQEVWKCETLEDGRDLLEEMEEELAALQQQADEEYEKFKEQWEEWRSDEP